MNPKPVLLARSTWLLPIILLVGLAAVLPAVYLAATADPQGHLTDLPIALVVEPQTSNQGPPAADRVSAAVEAGAGDALAVTTMTTGQLEVAMREDQVAGAVVIPAEFDASIASLFPGAARTVVPTVAIKTNAGNGGLSSGLVTANLTPLLNNVARGLGSQLLASVGAGTLPAANVGLLTDPFDVASGPYRPLPANSGLGTSAFYYSLVLVLVAFIGASLVNPLVDSALGIIPSELGPLVTRQRYTAVSRLRTFLGKAAILVTAAPLAALTLQGIAAAIGITAPGSFLLWLFSTAVIAAIGTSALAVFATLGPGIGSIVNTLFFVALAMVSSGGTVPVEATPPFFKFVSEITPFRHVIDGARSLFYFDGNLRAGLGKAWISIAIGGTLGMVLGVVVTTLYGRVQKFSRGPHPDEGGPVARPEDDNATLVGELAVGVAGPPRT